MTMLFANFHITKINRPLIPVPIDTASKQGRNKYGTAVRWCAFVAQRHARLKVPGYRAVIPEYMRLYLEVDINAKWVEMYVLVVREKER